MSDPISANRSALNPNDAAIMSKQMQPGMTIRDFLAKFGLSPDDPVEKLVEMQKNQIQNATPVGKMESMAGPGPGAPPGGMAPPEPQGQPMDRILSMR